MARNKQDKTPDGILPIARNKPATHDFEILETLETGMVLVGTEVKSLRNHAVNFSDAYCRVLDDELYVIGLNISIYKQAGDDNHQPDRRRKLLAKKREIRKLKRKTDEQGLTIVPLSIYFKNGKAKLSIGLARGKRRYDKRKTLKEKAVKRDMDRAMRRRE